MKRLLLSFFIVLGMLVTVNTSVSPNAPQQHDSYASFHTSGTHIHEHNHANVAQKHSHGHHHTKGYVDFFMYDASLCIANVQKFATVFTLSPLHPVQIDNRLLRPPIV